MTHPRRLMRSLGLAGCIALAGCMALAGCQMLRLPRLPMSIKKPATEVTAVQLVEQGPDAARFAIAVTLTNPNDQPLPLVEARYHLHIEGMGTYTGDTHPNAVIPANGQQSLLLPAAIDLPEGQAVGRTYRVGGSVQYHPPGEIRNLTYDIGLPLPAATFVGNGSITSAAPPTDTADNSAKSTAAPAEPTAPPANQP